MASMSPSGSLVGASGASPVAESGSPSQSLPPKNVAFELCFQDGPQYRARLPMRVQIYPHDNTESDNTLKCSGVLIFDHHFRCRRVLTGDTNGDKGRKHRCVSHFHLLLPVFPLSSIGFRRVCFHAFLCFPMGINWDIPPTRHILRSPHT